MSDEELKNLWRQPLASPSGSPTDVVAGMRKRMRKFDKTIFWRDVREVGACVFIVLFFGAYYFRPGSTLTKLGCVELVFSAVFIGWKILAAHRFQGRDRRQASTREFILSEREKVLRQIRLLETVVWWYLLPLYVGVALFSMGGNPSWIATLVYLAAILFLYAGIYWLNLYAVRKSLRPLKEQLERTLQEMPEFFEKGE